MADRLEMLGALGDSTRQDVLNLLRRGPSTVGELAGQLPVSRPAVSQHLQVLKTAGLLEEERKGAIGTARSYRFDVARRPRRILRFHQPGDYA